MDERREREIRALTEAVGRGWADAEALVRWLAEQVDGPGALLDGAVARGVLDAERRTRLAEDTDDPVVRRPAGPPEDPPTRSLRGRVHLAEAAIPPPVLPDAPTAVADTISVDKRVPEPSPEQAAGVPTPPALVTLPGELPFSAESRMASGRYELGPVVGRGGMGVVHVARDCSLGRRVALKMLRSSGRLNPGYALALAREAQTTGQLDHPGIVPVYELRAEPDGTVFYTMKLVTGVSLSDVVRRLKAGQPEAVKEYRLVRRLQVFQQICMAMHYAHKRGVLHRDLKPSNILLGHYGEVLIVDWGIAQVIGVADRLRDGTGVSDAPIDRRRLVGTPFYMSPEQASGNLADLDVRSDIFALGVILYELVALALPFDEPDTGRYLERIRSEPLPAPSSRKGGRRLSPDLEAIIRRATAFDRRDRYPDARALWEDVEAWLEGRQERDRRREESSAAYLRGRNAAARYHDLTKARAVVDRRIQDGETALDAWSPRGQKEELSRLVLQRENFDLLMARRFSDATLELQRAIAADGEAAAPRQALAELLRERFEAAELRRDVVAMTYFGDQIAQYTRDDGDSPAARGRVDIRTWPEGAEVSSLSVRDLEADPEAPRGRLLGRAPLVDVSLSAGIHLLAARMDGYRDARYPVFVRAGTPQSVLLALTPWSAAQPMVGREGELAELRALFETVLLHGRARACLILGEPGSGRTRLQEAFGDYIDALPDVVVFTWVHCLSSHQGVPFHALTEALRFRCGLRPDDGAATIRDRLHAMTRDVWADDDGVLDDGAQEEADRVADRLATLPGFELTSERDPSGVPDARHAALEQALASYFRRLGRRHPIVMIFKEMQWCDRASRGFLERFVAAYGAGASPEDGEGVPLFVLGSTTEHSEARHLQGRPLLPGAPRLTLPPLVPAATSQLLVTLLKGRAADDVTALVHERAAGNPYLVEELAQFLRERGLVESTDGEWRLVEGAAPDLPEVEVSHFIAQRVRSLAPAAQEALRHAAVVGRVFWAEALEWLGVDSAKPLLEELARRDLVQPIPHARYGGTTEYTFRLETLWRVAYADVPLASRRELHRLTADWLASRDSGAFAHRALLAFHRDRSRDAPAAAILHTALAREAAALGAWDEAIYHWDRALARPLAPDDRANWREAREEALAARAG